MGLIGGIISGNTAGESGDGIQSFYGILRKQPSTGSTNSGIIYGSEAVGNDSDGIPLRNYTNGSSGGHAVYGTHPLRRNTTAGETDYIDTTTGRGLSADGYAPFGQ